MWREEIAAIRTSWFFGGSFPGSEVNKSDFYQYRKKPEAVKVRRHERVESAHLAWIPLAVSKKVMTQ